MFREINTKLSEWKDKDDRKPLLLRGARQVGKTWLVQSLAKEFTHFVKIDFEQSPQYSRVFDGDIAPDRLCSEIELISGIPIIENQTLLFFDEVQACPRALMSMRYFYEQRPALHLIATGSLLEFAFRENPFPVGRISTIEVSPMSFPEYLEAIGNQKAAEICSSPITKVTESGHHFLMEALRNYFLLGGMPEAVGIYAQTKSLKQASDIQHQLVNTYRLDFNKYVPNVNVNCLNTVLLNVAGRVGQQLKYVKLASDYTIPTIKKAFEGLLLARLVTKLKAVGNPSHPMELYASDKKFKGIMLDIGIMNRLMGLDHLEVIQSKNLLSLYRGQLAEQFVGQEFVAASNQSQYYWARDAKSSSAEIDFLLTIDGKTYPVEVKDGPAGKLRSLHLFKKEFEPSRSFVLHAGNGGFLKKENIVFLPLYFAWSLARYGLSDETILNRL